MPRLGEIARTSTNESCIRARLVRVPDDRSSSPGWLQSCRKQHKKMKGLQALSNSSLQSAGAEARRPPIARKLPTKPTFGTYPSSMSALAIYSVSHRVPTQTFCCSLIVEIVQPEVAARGSTLNRFERAPSIEALLLKRNATTTQ